MPASLLEFVIPADFLFWNINLAGGWIELNVMVRWIISFDLKRLIYMNYIRKMCLKCKINNIYYWCNIMWLSVNNITRYIFNNSRFHTKVGSLLFLWKEWKLAYRFRDSNYASAKLCILFYSEKLSNHWTFSNLCLFINRFYILNSVNIIQILNHVSQKLYMIDVY